jgi:uncharacterized protein with beta-barrel porin domain
MKVNGATVNDKAGADGKTSKAVVKSVLQHAPENRWGVWVTGFGDFVDVDGDGNAQGYNFTTGGVSVGLDYRITDQLAIGSSATTPVISMSIAEEAGCTRPAWPGFPDRRRRSPAQAKVTTAR